MNLDIKNQMRKKATLLKLALRTNGIRVEARVEGVGTNIKENINGLYQINKSKNEPLDLIPNEIVLYEKITTKLVCNPQSYFSLRKKDENFYVYSDFLEEPFIQVSFSKRPEHYSWYTSKGTPMKYIGQVMGSDCLAIAIDKQCVHFKTGDFCRYCNINPTNFKSNIPRFSDLEGIGELISVAGKKYRFIDLTGGTFENRDEECRYYTLVGNIIKKNLGKNKISGPFSFTPPDKLSLLDSMYETGIDVISFNLDVWNDSALKRICPGKYKIGKEKYEQALIYAKDLWGVGNSVIQFLAGPWESNQSLLEGTKYWLEKGILVNITTFYPSPGSSLRNIKPKNLSELVSLYIDYGKLISSYGFYPNERRSILTSESGNRSSIVNEVVKGYLTEKNFDIETDLNFARGNIK